MGKVIEVLIAPDGTAQVEGHGFKDGIEDAKEFIKEMFGEGSSAEGRLQSSRTKRIVRKKESKKEWEKMDWDNLC